MHKTSLKTQMFFTALILFAAVILANIYILVTTSQIQSISNQRFIQERYLKNLQDELQNYHDTTILYLSSKSSSALAHMLISAQSIRKKVQTPPEKTQNTIALREREIYSLILRYLELSDNAVQAKRARNIPQYTADFEEMNNLVAFINSEIDAISLARFRQQLVSYEEFISESQKMHTWTLILIVNMTILAITGIAAVTGKLIKPLAELIHSSQQISAGNFETPDIAGGSWYEIDELINGFNRMKSDIAVYIKEIEWKKGIEQEFLKERLNNLKMQQLIKRMELYTMQAQMNPHFLFNTLNTGVQLAIVEGADNTAEYMEQLASLFRHNLSEKNVIVPLKHEIDGLEAYFSILRIRFPKTLTLELDVPEEIQKTCKVPASILQPLAENSIVHGFKHKTGQNSIRVAGTLHEHTLVLSVEDNGSGMDSDQIKKLLQRSDPDSSSSKVMGLENVIQRLYFFYPKNTDCICIESSPGVGTKICINIDTQEEPCIPF